MCRIGSTETSLAEWKSLFDVNVFSLVTALRASLPALRRSTRGGRIVFVSSGAAVKGGPGWGPYNASKAAMNSLCRSLHFASAASDRITDSWPLMALAGRLHKKSRMSSPLLCGLEWWILKSGLRVSSQNVSHILHSQMQSLVREKAAPLLTQADYEVCHKRMTSQKDPHT